MQNAAAGGPAAASEDRSDLHRAIVSDLVCLIEHVRATTQLIEQACAGEAPLGYQETGTNIFVLDDVTPRYLRARAALNNCEAHLGTALRAVLDTRTPQPGADGVGPRRQPVRSIGRA